MDDLEVGSFTIPAGALEEGFVTSGGPGGQHSNRTESAVRLRLHVDAASLPDDVRDRLIARLGRTVEVTASDSRSQWRNRALARQRLRERLNDALIEPPTRRRTKRTRSSHRRRLAAKRARSKTKRLRRRPELDD